jgi:hypothetical protein
MADKVSIEDQGKTAIRLPDGREVFADIPYFRGGKRPPDLDDIIKFAKEHPEVKLMWWDGSELRQL